MVFSSFGFEILVAPYTVLVLFPNSKTCNAEIVRDVIDNQRAEPGVYGERDGQGGPDEHCGISRGGLDNRRSAKNMRQIGVHRADDAPDPDPVPGGEWCARNVREDHPPNLVREL